MLLDIHSCSSKIVPYLSLNSFAFASKASRGWHAELTRFTKMQMKRALQTLLRKRKSILSKLADTNFSDKWFGHSDAIQDPVHTFNTVVSDWFDWEL